jgi:ABC-type Fe3+-siderophore transport system permease subunit
LNISGGHPPTKRSNTQWDHFWAGIQHLWYTPSAHPWFVGIVWGAIWVACFTVAYIVYVKVAGKTNARVQEVWGPKIVTGAMIFIGVVLYVSSEKHTPVKLFDVQFPDIFTPMIYILVAFIMFKVFISLIKPYSYGVATRNKESLQP